MIFENEHQSPFRIQLSFHRVIEVLEQIAASDVDYRSAYATGLLSEVAQVPELRSGITDISDLRKHEPLIRNLLADLFPTALTKNEIKAVTVPFQDITFNYTQRFTQILAEAGENFNIYIRNYDSDSFYLMSCCMILNSYYGYNVDFAEPFFYDIPDRRGIIRHYRILYNADFLEVVRTDKSIDISPEDFQQLIDNSDDIALWKKKFPPGSWLLKGFGIMSLFDNTVEGAISLLKTSLLKGKKVDQAINHDVLTTIFRSLFNLPDIRVGFSEFINIEDDEKPRAGLDAPCYLLSDSEHKEGCEAALRTIMDARANVVISDMSRFGTAGAEQQMLASQMIEQGIGSCILAPVVKRNKMYGVVEVVSPQPFMLNSVNARMLDLVMPFFVDTLDRYYTDTQNRIDAIIQKEYTAIHPSVYWKFREEAVAHIGSRTKDLPYREIVFNDVVPLYGQIDVRNSSTIRNIAVSDDLSVQLGLLSELFAFLSEKLQLPVISQSAFEIDRMRDEIKTLRADTEVTVQSYILSEIHPMLNHFRMGEPDITAKINAYFESLEPKYMMVYDARKNFDSTLARINKRMATILDRKQEAAQTYFPHYYERFKTDGVEHNLYIGASIAPTLKYNPVYLNNLRLWQLQVMCEMENEYLHMRRTLVFDLEVTSLILAFSTPISIRFRMDEKRFDVDGTYNARYEVVKKRIDKSTIKNTSERIIKPGTITIVYTHEHEEAEYRKYIRLLCYKGLLEKDVESFDVEDLQGVTGLKALRVGVVYGGEAMASGDYTYDELVREYEG